MKPLDQKPNKNVYIGKGVIRVENTETGHEGKRNYRNGEIRGLITIRSGCLGA